MLFIVAKICAYAQGFQLMNIAAKEHGWEIRTLLKLLKFGVLVV